MIRKYILIFFRNLFIFSVYCNTLSLVGSENAVVIVIK